MSRRHGGCNSEGCDNDVVYKTVEGTYSDSSERQRGARGSPTSYHRHSIAPTQIMSAYCKLHTCVHFARQEGCNNKKPPHDTVCAVHVRCPVQGCAQARGQYLDTKFEHIPGSVPRYARYELCFDHKCMLRLCIRGKISSKNPYCSAHGCQAEGCASPSQDQRNCCAEHECRADGCRTIVEDKYPFCVIHVKCKVQNCNMARYIQVKAGKEECLDFCLDHVTCQASRCRELKKHGSHYCASHTCHERDCEKSCLTKPYCDDHRCAAPSCESPKLGAGESNSHEEYCPMHTCRLKGCCELVGPLALFCPAHSCSAVNCLQQAMAEQLCIVHFKEEYMARGEDARHASEIDRRKQPFKEHIKWHPKEDKRSATNSSTVTDTETSENEKRGNRTAPRRNPNPPLSIRATDPVGRKATLRHLVDVTSPRGSGVSLATDSLDDGSRRQSFPAFVPEHGEAPIPSGSFKLPDGGGRNGTGSARNSMASESGASTATTRAG